MPKLSVREQQALTNTVVKRISDIQKTHAEHEFKEIKDEIQQYTKEYLDLKGKRDTFDERMSVIKNKHSALVNRFNKNRKWIEYSSDYRSYNSSPDENFSFKVKIDHWVRDEILREITVSQLITNEDIEKTIEQLVIKFQPLKAFKVVNG